MSSAHESRGSALRALVSPAMLLLHVVAVAGVTGALLLGLWQYDAWQRHRDNRAAELARSLVDAEPRPLTSAMSADEPFPADAIGRPVSAEGRWLADETVYVAGKQHDGRDGYWAVTPFAVCDDLSEAACGDAPAVLVVRGWTAEPVAAPTPSGSEARDGAARAGGSSEASVTVVGWLQPGEGPTEADPEPTDRVLPSVRVADVLQRLDRDLYSAYVIEDRERSPAASAGGSDGLQPVTPDAVPDPPAFTALRNLLYALEWWVFGLFAVVVWLRWCRDEVTGARARRSGEDPGEQPGEQPDDGDVRSVSGEAAEREAPENGQVPSAP